MRICDLCGYRDDEPNDCCPQHRMWRFERERDEARAEIERLGKKCNHQEERIGQLKERIGQLEDERAKIIKVLNRLWFELYQSEE